LKVLSGRQRFLKKSGPKIINKKTFKKNLKVLSGRRGFPKNRDKLLASLNAKNLQEKLEGFERKTAFPEKIGTENNK
jgi:hypothetical protein